MKLAISKGLCQSPSPHRDLDFWKVPNDPQTQCKEPELCLWVGGRKDLVMKASIFSVKDFAPAEGKEQPVKTLNSHFTWDLEETHTHTEGEINPDKLLRRLV